MKTEREILEENARHEYAKQKTEEFTDFLKEMVKDLEEKTYWEGRANLLFAVVLLLNIATLLFSAYYFGDYDAVESPLDFFSLLTWIALLRVYWHLARRMYCEGKLDGAFDTLRKLGMLNDDDETEGKLRKRTKRKSPFRRFKELWERIGERKSKEKYA